MADATAAYLDRARRRNDTRRMKVSHRHNDINPDEPQTRLLSLGGNRLLPTLTWHQNPRYNAGNMGAEFMDNYAWSGLGLTGSDNISFDVLLLGPGVTYPPTSYESEGVFLVIGGSPEWKSDDDPWVRMEAGSIICRPYGGAEGKRPGREPMLALYARLYR
ncbi:MAG: dimethylsulfonioproprionate lyase family protein [Gammaproteobacteria bacterium]|nr:dimethylsulfonioproprionate lyase family protein [Gammaproteobacteria bacterium]